jgi:hypothetical protein
MDSIPKALQYGVANSQARVVRQKLQPLGVSSGAAGSTVRFLLSQKAIIDMRSLSFNYDYVISGLVNTDANNFSNAQIPATYQHWSSVKVFCSGASAAGAQCNHYDMVHHALAKVSVGEDYCNSRLNNAYESLINYTGADGRPSLSQGWDAATGTKRLQATFDDLVLFRSKNSCYDSSLFGNIEIELTFNNNNILKIARAGTPDAAAAKAAITHAFSNITCSVDTVVSISPLYVSLLSERLQVSTPIRLPFSEVRTVLASNTGSNRITLQSSCVDAVMVGFLNADPNAYTPTDAAGALAIANMPRYKYAIDPAQQNAMAFQLTVGSEVFPRQAVQKLAEIADITTNSIFGNSTASTNLLYVSAVAATGLQSYSRAALATDGAIAITKFGLGEEGYASGLLVGLQTNGVATDCVVSSNQAAASHLLIASLQTSQLVFDPQTSAVSIEA